jgi:hypothetical protein
MAKGGGGAKPMGHRAALHQQFAWGSPEEVAQRDKGAYQPESPSFVQIGPAGGPGGNFNELPTDRVSGTFKFNKNV